MKKTAYIAPATNVLIIEVQQLLNTISGLSETNVDGLGISEKNYDGEGRSRHRSIWDDED